jgi:hypothetical protein
MEIGRLILSSKVSYKINNKLGKKCYIINSNEEHKIIETGKDFISNDIYIKIKDNKIIDNFGIVGIYENDIKIFYELFTLNWLSNKNFNLILPLCPDKYSFYRINYINPVFVIDPPDSTDHDDGFSLSSDDINYYLDIHIADPTAFIDLNHHSSIPFLNELLKRLNTCYIPHYSNYSLNFLLPKKLLQLSSLSGSNKPAITFKFIINKSSNNFSFSFVPSLLINIHNFNYHNFPFDFDLFSSVFISIKSFLNINISFDSSNFINKFIEIIMLLTNHSISNHFISNNKFFICRSQDKFNFDSSSHPNFHNLLNHSANYIFTNLPNSHFNLNLSNYSHVTSPLRRFIDILNHFIIHNENILDFIHNLDFISINSNYKKYKKIYSAFHLFNLLHSNNNIFDAIILDIFNHNFCLLGLFFSPSNLYFIIHSQLPINYSNLPLFHVFRLQLFFNPHKFFNSTFPFFFNII